MGNLKNTGTTTGVGTGESVVESSITTRVKANKAGVGEAARIDAQVASKTGEAKMKGLESLAYGTQAADASAEAATWGVSSSYAYLKWCKCDFYCFCRISRTDV